MSPDPPLAAVAAVLARALVGEAAAPEEIDRFERAVGLRAPDLGTGRDRALWRLLARGPGWAKLVDAGLALADPHSPVRHRVCLMLAILEASPHHVRRFLPAPWSAATPLALVATGLAAALRSAAGLALVRSHGTLWR